MPDNLEEALLALTEADRQNEAMLHEWNLAERRIDELMVALRYARTRTGADLIIDAALKDVRGNSIAPRPAGEHVWGGSAIIRQADGKARLVMVSAATEESTRAAIRTVLRDGEGIYVELVKDMVAGNLAPLESGR